MSLANVVVVRTGTGWTVDVTGAQLSSNTAEKDFTVLHNGIATPTVSYTKTTQFVLTYTGAAVPASTAIEVRRKTSFDNSSNYVSYANRFSSSTWNNALAKIQRWEEEVDLNGAGAIGAGVIPLPQNDAYGAVWTNDITYSPSRKALWDKIETLAPTASPTFTGVPLAPSNGSILNTTRILNHADAFSALSFKADLASPAFSGNPTAPTQVVGDNSTRLATTAFVKSLAYAPLLSPALTGTPTSVTPAVNDSSTSIATTAYVKNEVGKPNFRVYRNVAGAGLTGAQPVTWTGEDFDTGNAVGTTNFVAPVAGTYFFGVSVYMFNTSAGVVTATLYFQKNGSFHTVGQQIIIAAGSAHVLSGTALIPLAVSDTVSISVTNNNGGATYTLGEANTLSTAFTGFRIT